MVQQQLVSLLINHKAHACVNREQKSLPKWQHSIFVGSTEMLQIQQAQWGGGSEMQS